MKRALLVGVLLGALLSVGVGGAQQYPPPGQYIVYAFGNNSCGDWLEKRKLPQTNIFRATNEAWVYGFVSGYAFGGSNIKKTDYAALDAFIDAYCAAHPLDTIATAAQALVKELRVKTR